MKLQFEPYMKDSVKATYNTSLGPWKFIIEEHDTCLELFILDYSNHRRVMCKSKFDTPSQARAAAQAFFDEYLSPI